jgi:hypothetical protein
MRNKINAAQEPEAHELVAIQQLAGNDNYNFLKFDIYYAINSPNRQFGYQQKINNDDMAAIIKSSFIFLGICAVDIKPIIDNKNQRAIAQFYKYVREKAGYNLADNFTDLSVSINSNCKRTKLDIFNFCLLRKFELEFKDREPITNFRTYFAETPNNKGKLNYIINPNEMPSSYVY